MAGDLSGQAVGAVVELHVDMDARTLGVAVNEGDGRRAGGAPGERAAVGALAHQATRS